MCPKVRSEEARIVDGLLPSLPFSDSLAAAIRSRIALEVAAQQDALHGLTLAPVVLATGLREMWPVRAGVRWMTR